MPSNWLPATPGVYERKFKRLVMYAQWTGFQWLLCAPTPLGAARQSGVSLRQPHSGVSVPWRGLVEKTE
jgi:hypothetical protein